MKKGWFAVKVDNASIKSSIVHYQDNSITRVWITEDEISFMVGSKFDWFGKSKCLNVNFNYIISTSEFNKLKAHLEEIIGITEEKLLEKGEK